MIYCQYMGVVEFDYDDINSLMNVNVSMNAWHKMLTLGFPRRNKMR